jgi:hypothetical protein
MTKNNAANTSSADLDEHGFDRPLAVHGQPNPSREAAISAAGRSTPGAVPTPEMPAGRLGGAPSGR